MPKNYRVSIQSVVTSFTCEEGPGRVELTVGEQSIKVEIYLNESKVTTMAFDAGTDSAAADKILQDELGISYLLNKCM